MKAKRGSNNPEGRPIAGSERKRPFNVMLEPTAAEQLRKLGGNNLSRGIVLALKQKSPV